MAQKTNIDFSCFTEEELVAIQNDINSALNVYRVANETAKKQKREQEMKVAYGRLADIRNNIDSLFAEALTLHKDFGVYFEYEIGEATVSTEDGEWASSSY